MSLPTYEKDTYILESGEKRHQESPDTFWIPEAIRRHNLSPGDLVKLIFSMETREDPNEVVVERMWVLIESQGNGWYQGVLDNEPTGDVSVVSGQSVFFNAEHVIDIYG